MFDFLNMRGAGEGVKRSCTGLVTDMTAKLMRFSQYFGRSPPSDETHIGIHVVDTTTVMDATEDAGEF